MEPIFHKISLPANDFDGGSGHVVFQGHELFLDGTELGSRQSSDPRPVIALPGANHGSASATCEFDVAPDFFATPDSHRRHWLWITGMWDHYRWLGSEFGVLHSLMSTCGHFRIVINDTTVFDGEVFFWNYRQWRFWPTFDINVAESAFRPGRNVLLIENLTPPFSQKYPAELREFLPCPAGDQHNSPGPLPPPEITENTTFNLAEIRIATRHLDHCEVLNAPRVVRTGEAFLIEVYATVSHELTVAESLATLLSASHLDPGRNKLFFRIDEPRGAFTIDAGAFTVTIEQAVTAKSATGFLCGHMIGGCSSAFPLAHDYNDLVELFRDTQQGNLLVWLASPAKAGAYITADQLPIDDIRAAGLKVLFRYYGMFPESCTYPPQVSRCIDALGDAFVALASHEQGGFMGRAMASAADRHEAMAVFTSAAAERLSDIRRVAGDKLVWITDPSLYGHVYRRNGADRVGLELFPLQCNINIASVRGTARMCGDPDWTAINSFECQAWGGLAMPEQMAQLDDQFDEKRQHLWWFSQFHLYLAGARTIYSESGAFDQVVTRHWHMDDHALVNFRQAQRDLLAFANVHPLPQPIAEFALMKDAADIFSDTYSPADELTQPSDLSWSTARVAWPQLRWLNAHLRGLTSTVEDRRSYSDTPYGEVDIITADASVETLAGYRAIVLVGDHAITEATAENLARYVRGGGELVVTLADFADADVFTQLTGATRRDPAEEHFLWELDIDTDLADDFVAFDVPNALSQGLFDGVVLGNIEVAPATRIVIADRLTNTPFLTTNQIGAGRVWLINTPYHHRADRPYNHLVNSIVEAVFKRIARPVRLIEGSCVNHFLYQHGDDAAPWYQMVVLNNDWFSDIAIHSATFQYGEISFTLDVQRGAVTQCFLLPGAVVIPDSPHFCIDSVEPRPGGVLVQTQGPGPITVEILKTGQTERRRLAAVDRIELETE